MSGILSLVYVSSAVRPLSAAEIHQLLEAARKRNAEYEVTGVLLHCDGSFMQYIEGPPAGVEHVYGNIRRATRHRGMIEITREVIAAREFGDWSMAYRSTEVSGYVGSATEKALFDAEPHVPAKGISPSRVLLQNFWNRALRR